MKQDVCIKCMGRILGKESDSAIVFYAFRYALGRMTYVSQEVSDYIIAHWDQLNPSDREAIQVEIREAIRRKTAGMEMDVKLWQRILAL